MRISHIEMERRMNDEMSTLTDEQVFASYAFAAYLTDMAEIPLRQVGHKRLRIITFWDPSSTFTTLTTEKQMQINCGNSLTQSLPTRRLRGLSLVGDTGHEVGHIRYTNFAMLRATLQRMAVGRTYHRDPETATVDDELALEEYKEYLADIESPGAGVVMEMYKELWNLVEDIYVNERMCADFPGVFAAGIRLSEARFLDLVPSVQKMLDDGVSNIAIAFNLLYQYAASGDINNITAYSGELLDRIYECLSYVDDCIYDDDPRSRFFATHAMMVKLWPYVKEQADKANEKKQNGAAQQTATEETMDDVKKDLIGNTPLPKLNSKPSPELAPFDPDFDTIEADKDRAVQVLEEEAGRIALTKTDTILEGNDGSISYDSDYAGTGYDRAGQDIFRLMSNMAKEHVEMVIEEELSAELQEEADKIRYGNAHAGINVTVNRMTRVPEALAREYKSVAPPLHMLAQKTQDELKLTSGVTSTHVMHTSGSRINPSAAFRRDGKIFRKPIHHPKQSVAFALLVDESASMGGCDRITRARATSIVMHKLCLDMGIPHIIYGHSTGDGVQLYSYVEFDSVDNNDCHRLMDMSARSCNRDGAALRFVAERLMTRPEKNKILILISDGQPSDFGYGGTEAEADLRGIKAEYDKKGIKLFAAAIGNDKDRIERIYKDAFLDVTNLDDFPKNLARMVAQYTKR